MSACGKVGGGHALTGLQSKSLGHSTLKEKPTEASWGSKPPGTELSPPPLISRRVYVEKSPAAFTFTVKTLPAVVTDSTVIPVMRTPASITTFDWLRAGFAGTPFGWPGRLNRNVTVNVFWSAAA